VVLLLTLFPFLGKGWIGGDFPPRRGRIEVAVRRFPVKTE